MSSKELEVEPLQGGKKQVEGKFTGPLCLTTLAIVWGSFQFGYHIGCINAPGDMIKQWFGESHNNAFGKPIDQSTITFLWSTAVSIFGIGGMAGGLLSGWFADRFGRRGALLLNNIFAFIAAALMALCKMVDLYPLMIIGRLVIGFHSGLASGLVPMYLTEVSPINLRGTLGSIHQLFVTIAILVSQVLGLNFLFGTTSRWPWIFAMTVVPAILQLIMLPMCPESPKYSLVVKNQSDAAEAALKKLRGRDDVKDELEAIQEEATAAQNTPKVSMLDLFKGSLRWPMFIAIMMMLSQQLSGINAAMFYSNTIFKSAGLDDQQATYATIAMGSINVLMTVISVYLVDHPKFGRRLLHLIGLSVMFIASMLIVLALTMIKNGSKGTWSYLAIAFVLLFVIGFATGPGSIPWFFVSELFGSGARGPASSVAAMVNWTANFFVGLLFLPIEGALKQNAFFIFSGFLLVFIIFTWKFVPETKGKTVEQINAEFDKRK
ncbi:unnamed protein product, partial [Mesorhabditis belari]|uniref:Major facilitator superfamily (MFS) profile domain-containing protein n=1 Tax=Mesorhabditis belari TaxID=2138241 RepID=A0AAF3E9B4_9BILA